MCAEKLRPRRQGVQVALLLRLAFARVVLNAMRAFATAA
jgi:hypothetical protein